MPYYFDEMPETAPNYRNFSFEFKGKNFTFTSASQVFSKDGPDKGSLTLVEGVLRFLKNQGEFEQDHLKIGYANPGEKTSQKSEAENSLLDLGCGYGIVAVLMKSFLPGLHFVLSDINERALELAKINIRTNRCGYMEILKSDGWKGLGDRCFKYVLSNPPIRAGKKTVFEFIEGAENALIRGGRLFIVISKKQGADSSYKKIQEIFGNCETVWRHGGFHVLAAEKIQNKV